MSGSVELNYHHLLYFWTVVRERGVSRAAEKLRLSQPTISAQVKMLEAALGERLLERQGRTLVLTDVGRVVDRYATEIFTAGAELLETLKGRSSGRAARLAVGVANAVPKLVVYRLLRPALEGPTPVQITCSEDDPEQLLGQLATHALDVVISDAPAAPHVRVKVFNHLLGESGTTFFAGRVLARGVSRHLPLPPTPTRPCFCRPSTTRCAGRWSSGSTRKIFIQRSSESSKTRPCSRHLASAGVPFLPRPPRLKRTSCEATAWLSWGGRLPSASGITRFPSSGASGMPASRRSPTPRAPRSSLSDRVCACDLTLVTR
jgi:DNA-binding transcriptional LysR family regulator